MADRHTLKLTGANRVKAYKGVEAAIAKGKGGTAWLLELREPTRTDEQNNALHGLITQIMKQRTHHNGIRMDKRKWKAAFMQALGEDIEFIPTLDGDSLFPLGLSTRELPKEKFTQLIELILAWCAQQGLTVQHFDGAKDGEAPNKASPRVAA